MAELVRFRVVYRVVPHSSTSISHNFTYTIDAATRWMAEGIAANLLSEDMRHIQGYFDSDEIKRTTVTRR